MKFRVSDKRLDSTSMEYDFGDTLNKLTEECNELSDAARECQQIGLAFDDKDRSNLLCEVADVWIMIQRTLRKLHVPDKEFGIYVNFKLDRQVDRIERRNADAEKVRID